MKRSTLGVGSKTTEQQQHFRHRPAHTDGSSTSLTRKYVKWIGGSPSKYVYLLDEVFERWSCVRYVQPTFQHQVIPATTIMPCKWQNNSSVVTRQWIFVLEHVLQLISDHHDDN